MSPTPAQRLASLLEDVLGAPLPVRLRAWDGSEAGHPGSPDDPHPPTVIVRRRRALRRLLWSPGELGLARAFVSGDLDVDGDVADGLSRFWQLARPGSGAVRPDLRQKVSALRTAARLRAVGPPPKPPASEARLGGRLHTRRRDSDAISHHYDLSNEFYAFLLDPQMAYSCGYWTRDEGPDYTLVDAQRDKLDLICRKLGLGPGMRLLDVGCGWASLLVHAAEHYGVHATGVTLSAQQRDYGVERVRRAGLSDRVEIRLQDYREIDDQPFDAVASIEMGEHVGQDNYPVYAERLHRLLRPHGRLLLQQMSRGSAGANTAPGGGAFMESYVAPDMYMRPLGETLGFLERAGHEIVDVHSLREHYVWTVRPWLETLQRHRETAVRMIGEEQWRIWLLYLAGAALAFEENRMGVHQVLTVRPGTDGTSGLPRSRSGILGRDPALDPAPAAPAREQDPATAG
ncbi:Cyclopropane-fatty-acyl-phospholipid synthase [Pseudonocardia sp. Ae168_Ps1]|uniref:SAM-dependent methyltransferase n=1 Tax=unclassified Pseudonocardia TaxID=2619320 RepID=UPI000705EA64|nr:MULTISPECIES: cyclopropane-fatty-acyl-phospholipid synthase family protein [unclassified Pseudonocardia]ALL77900.1 cyclopropane-fatty-acyl-phospholipid synthase [Pseudonocardia sp. EC080610-09]ALL80814.1 cyclopropane-fatty-acyl-phospholipid synthase [Pseudonocardia sp. EC080619-01]OLL76683.1 Cyclopropane-fatty-acyl-phospholipid synthase [Pseudonocardia sp. Ae150A_Ps1]OLL82694.1 Cyclopropane-fatty-acyl-phospholipid synthase [Pseudonocardia sp. Ae168_Ps1]OLL83193.1 Cyclopropane-fatty-acyl-pho